MKYKLSELPGKVLTKLTSLQLIDRRYQFAIGERLHLTRFLPHYRVDCVFDIGANEGQYARMLRRHTGYRGLIISFEPNPATAAIARNYARRDGNWIVEEIAVSRADGEQTFNVMAASQFSSLSKLRANDADVEQFLESGRVTKSFSVRTETLTTAYERLVAAHGFKRPFLKMDTQGYDVEIVRHAGPAIRHFVGLQSEMAFKKVYESSVDWREAIALYESLGFELSAIVANNGGQFPALVESDCIMNRREV